MILKLSPHPLFLPPSPPTKLLTTTTTLTAASKPLTTTTTTTDSGLLFREKLNYLESLNINTRKALTLSPSLRTTSLSSLTTITDYLSSLGLSPPSIGRILDMHPQLLTATPCTHFHPITTFLLTEAQIPPLDIPKSLTRCPRLLVSDVRTQLRPTLLFLKKIGFVGKNRVTCQTSLLLVYSVRDTLLRKIEFLMGLGLKYHEVCNMVVRSPGLLTFGVESNLRVKAEFLMGEMGLGVAELVRFPQYFSFSLEGRIMPRFRVLVETGVRMGLDEMLKVSDGEFNSRVIELRLRSVEGR